MHFKLKIQPSDKIATHCPARRQNAISENASYAQQLWDFCPDPEC